MKPVLAIDFDDVINNFNAAFSAFHNRVYGTKVRYGDIFTHDMHLVYGCEESEMPARLDHFYTSIEHANMKPIVGMLPALRELVKHFEIHIVTNRPVSRNYETWQWINKWARGLVSAVWFTNFYDGKEHEIKRHKSVVCKEIGAVYLIEDAPRHIAEAVEAGIMVFVPDRPWNQQLEPLGEIRLNSWEEIASCLLTQLRQKARR